MRGELYIYVLDTKNQADKAEAKINALLREELQGYKVNKWFEPVQVPADSPRTTFRGKWLVKFPWDNTKTWKRIKNRITEMTAYDPARKYKITVKQYKNAMRYASPS